MSWTSTKRKKKDEVVSVETKKKPNAIIADIDLEDDILNFNEMELIRNKSSSQETEKIAQTKTDPKVFQLNNKSLMYVEDNAIC